MGKATFLSLLIWLSIGSPFIPLHSTLAGDALSRQDLAVKVEEAEVVVTVSGVTSTQLKVDGESIGPPKVENAPTVVREPQKAVVLKIKYNGNLEDCFIKLKSDTCKPKRLSLGVYVISEPGRHNVEVQVLNRETGDWPDTEVTVDVGEAPLPPVPDPVDPINPDEPAPIASGPRVLVVYEAMDRTKMNPAQLAILSSRPLRDYLNKVCFSRNNLPEWRILDKDAQFSTSGQETFIALMKERPEDNKLPWVIIAGDLDVVYSGPLPATVNDLISLIDKYVPKSAKPVKSPTYRQVQICDENGVCRLIWVEE